MSDQPGRNALKNFGDAAAFELLMTLFKNAVCSFRSDSLLKPCHPDFVTGDSNPDTSLMIDLLREVPRCYEDIQDWYSTDSATDAGKLVSWILDTGKCWLESDDNQKVKKIIEGIGNSSSRQPTAQKSFRVCYRPEDSTRFDQLRDEFGSVLLFHGSKLENFHSILRHGLCGHLNKESAFGEGTYFSDVLSMSLMYSKPSPSFSGERGALGARASCVALCEVIDQPGGLYRGDAGASRSVLADERVQVPSGYFLVKNNELIRLRYLLVFSDSPPPRLRQPGCLSWLTRRPLLLMLGLYVVFLLALSVSKSPSLYRFWNDPQKI